MVFYRKYRPQVINDLDNTTVRETLSSVLKNSQTHAFLFTGPKGLGKTSTARIIAKVVNCTRKKEGTIEPCNTCDQCVSITEGNNLDILEIDAASNRGIDEIRDLKDKIRLAPVSAQKKVYIIDEVHMLTTEAFNALLKTLEEPPSHAMFILCTTEPHKIPPTILSRCFHIQFSPATEEELLRAFNRIVKAEKIDITEDALKAIARSADRGFRDGVKNLEELVSLADGKKITAEFIESHYKTTSVVLLSNDLLASLAERPPRVKESLNYIKRVVEEGVDMKFFIQELLKILHDVLLEKNGVLQDKKNGRPVNIVDIDNLPYLIKLFSEAYQQTKMAVLPQLPLELAIIEYCQIDNVIPSDQRESRNLSQQSNSGDEDPSTSLGMTNKQEGVTVSSLRKQIGTIKKVQALYGTPKPDEEVKPQIKTTTVELMKASPNGEVTSEWKDAFWKNIISEIKNYNHTMAGVLRGCAIKSYDKETLIIETQYKFHKDKLTEGKTMDALVKICKLLTGKNIAVKVELKT